MEGLRICSSSQGPDDDRSVSSVIDLASSVGMVPVATVYIGVPLVCERPARLNGVLRHAGNTISPGCLQLVSP